MGLIMPTLYTEIEIYATPQQVWQALTQKENWLYWNTFLYDRDTSLPFVEGQEVFLSLRRIPQEEETEFQPLVTLVQPEICLKWFSEIPGLQNEHVFELQKIGSNSTKYVHREQFSGWLTRVFLPFIRQDEQQGLRRMARELKEYVESSQRFSKKFNSR
ncbi:MAG: SRPBCC domain-containing protein [Leptolyngbyaceae cyanobacterium bins.59]|nr:SRPBCC domain-containing protein [Leptolyngbyaceae cyanobacterium bins.59]